jgi:hypothetical protein
MGGFGIGKNLKSSRDVFCLSRRAIAAEPIQALTRWGNLSRPSYRQHTPLPPSEFLSRTVSIYTPWANRRPHLLSCLQDWRTQILPTNHILILYLPTPLIARELIEHGSHHRCSLLVRLFHQASNVFPHPLSHFEILLQNLIYVQSIFLDGRPGPACG